MNNFAGFGIHDFCFGAFIKEVHGSINFGGVAIASFHFADSFHKVEEESTGTLLF